MAAEEHLSSQFEIVHPHRAVRIGGQMFPAAHTTSDEDHPDHKSIGFKAAWVPMENGSLIRVSHFDDEPGKFYMHAPMKKGAADPGASSFEPHHPLPDQYGNTRPFLRVNGAEMAAKTLAGQANRPISAEEHKASKTQLQKFREQHAP
jgi:hypothetical protein